MSTATRKAVLAGISILVALGLAEILVGVLGLAPEVAFSDPARFRLTDNPHLGYEPVPFSRLEESFAPGGERTNALGFRDRDHTPAKPPGVFRILVLGDSIAAGYSIGQRELLFPVLLEQRLNESGLRAEVLNFGVSGYNTMQEVALLEERGLAFAPDLVLLAYCLNDIERNDGQILDNLLTLEESDTPRVVSPWNRRLAASALYRVVRYGILARADLPPDELRDRYRPLYENTVSRSLRHLGELARDHRFSTLVAVFPWFRGLMNEEQKYAAMQRAVQADCAAGDLGHIDLLRAFQECQTRTEGPLAFDPLHPNEAGHRCAAEAIARHILADPQFAASGP